MKELDLEQMLQEREAVLTAEYSSALDFADFDRRDTILDVATGSGRMLEQLVKRGYSVVSGDVDPGALDRARERLGDSSDEPTLVVLDAHAMQFDSDSFRAITFVNAIHEIDDPRGALDEILRVLADDGKLLVVEFNTRGFELMELHHRMQGKGEHRRGEMNTQDIDDYLRSRFDEIETRECSITLAWIASGKRIGAV